MGGAEKCHEFFEDYRECVQEALRAKVAAKKKQQQPASSASESS